ncbi:unnamed protein product, partial [Polarella glacialis]
LCSTPAAMGSARGPALLVTQLYNTVVERAPYSAAFVTGAYWVCDVSCAGCSIHLAKKYVHAQEASNQFKIGKFLLEKTLIFAPKCCSGSCSSAGSSPGSTSSTSCPLKGSSSQGVCVRCSRHIESRTAQAVLLITGGLQPGPSRKLREILVAEGQLFGDASPGERPLCCAPKAATAPPMATITPAMSEGVRGGLPWKLARLCGAVSSSQIPAWLVLDFVDRVASMLAATATARVHMLTAGPADLQGPSGRREAGASRGSRKASGNSASQGLPEMSSMPSQAVLALDALCAAAGVDDALLSSFPGSQDLKSTCSLAALRPDVLRWALVAPAA